MDPTQVNDVVIWGVTSTGGTFRPSDWSERLAGLTSAFHLSDRLSYSELVEPIMVSGVRAVIVSGALADKEPRLWRFLLNFARDNDLVTTDTPNASSAPQSLTPPKIERPARGAGEPREPV